MKSDLISNLTKLNCYQKAEDYMHMLCCAHLHAYADGKVDKLKSDVYSLFLSDSSHNCTCMFTFNLDFIIYEGDS